MGDLILRHANYGLELADELTKGPLIGPNNVSWQFVGAPPALEPTAFVVDRSRWVFEDLIAEVVFSIDAQLYVPRVLQTNTTELPAVPATGPGVLARVELKPRTGYPFAPGLTRAVGSVLLAADNSPVPDALVTITPLHDADMGSVLTTQTTSDGQYVMWFFPEPGFDPPWVTAFTATASATVNMSPVTGSTTTPVPVQQQALTYAPPILVS